MKVKKEMLIVFAVYTAILFILAYSCGSSVTMDRCVEHYQQQAR